MEPKYRFRLYILSALIIVGCGVLVHRLYQFQIVRQKEFVGNIPTTHTVSIFEPGIRGEITDRHGEPLAINVRSYELLFNLQEIYDAYRAELDATTTTTSGITDDPTDRQKRLEEQRQVGIDYIVDQWLMPRLQSAGLESSARFSKAVRTHFITHGGLVPFRYPLDLTYDEFARLAEQSYRLPGVSVNVRARRKYPYGTLACHLLGHLAEWKKDEIPEQFRKPRIHYTGNDLGIAGIEQSMNDVLTGQLGRKVIVRNEKNIVKKLEDYTPPALGAQVQLTIDTRIQTLAEQVLRRVGRGAAVVLDPQTGEILAMASVPNYDPNDFIPSITPAKWKAYNANRAEPFINRALAAFTPGSVFKIAVSLTAARHQQAQFHDRCIGYNTYGKTSIKCWKTGGHGSLDLSEAIQRSCNPYFMDLATHLGPEKITETFEKLGLGVPSGVRLPNESPGILPGSTRWSREIRPGQTLSRAGLAQVGIGQADSLATPLQICSLIATVANGGRYYQPRLVRRAFYPPDGPFPEEVLIENIPLVRSNLIADGTHPQDLERIRHGMWLAVNKPGGTASRVALPDVEVAAKTGTAQTGLPDHLDKNNAWTAAFAPYDQPRYAVCILVRNGRSGGKVAGVLVHELLRGIFGLEAGLDPRLEAMDYFAGNFDAYEEIKLPDRSTATAQAENEGEEGNTLDPDLLPATTPLRVKPHTQPQPTLAPTPDTPSEAPQAPENVELESPNLSTTP